ncbi:hypothetical protein [Streptomyces cavernae]|uniref:hypothetical protein n=1 Tax=Streptomyces cavernae TaxID=2259034 RepID=UPI000FEBD89A|nr:hypothetical protein [Streptomyces cavernae]
MRTHRAVLALMSALLLLLIPTPASASGAAPVPTPDPVWAAGGHGSARVVPPWSRYAGRTYGQWGAEWWRWALEIPGSVNPLTDPTGARCGIDQSGPVWFLAGTFGAGSASRTCTLPAGKALFSPIINGFYAERPGVLTYKQLRQELRESIDLDNATYEATLDGRRLRLSKAFRAASPPPPFRFTLPEDNIFEAPEAAGPYEGVSDGYWVLLKPLRRGTHVLTFHGTAPGVDVSVRYRLIVK